MTADIATIRRILTTDPVWSAYALADLHPDFAPLCDWYLGGVDRDQEHHAVALIFTGLEIPTLFLAGSPSGVADAVAQIDLPDQVYITVGEQHFPLVERYWDFSADTRSMWRLALAADATLPTPAAPGLVPLTVDDSDRVRELYSHGGPFAPDAFSPYQIENGVFYGIQAESGELLAAGGTHIVNRDEKVGAIGNMYTRPDHRSRGYAGAVLAAIVNTLRDDGVETIVLNVDQRNSGARRIYERHGFVVHCPYVEGIGQRKSDA